MATMITSECINCGACEPECPNGAIYQGGAAWELNGETHPALVQATFYIVPEKCTECVGFNEQEACAVVCPVDCCIPDPQRPESEETLLARAKQLHPGQTFAVDFPSRFRGTGTANGAAVGRASMAPPSVGAAVAPVPAPGSTPPVAAPEEKSPVVDLAVIEAPAVAPSRAAAPAGETGIGPTVQAPAAAIRVEKPLAPPPVALVAHVADRRFEGELSETFEEACSRLQLGQREAPLPTRAFAFLASPFLGALPEGQKRAIEAAVGDPRAFTTAGATGCNVVHNLILYPILTCAVAAAFQGWDAFSAHSTPYLILGVALAAIESALRLREQLQAVPDAEPRFRAALYGVPLSLAFLPLMNRLRRTEGHGGIGFDGFHGGTFEEKTERERRYGEVFELEERPNGYYLRFEFPRFVPRSATKDAFGIGDEMPDYDYDLSLAGRTFTVKGSVRDPQVRRLAAVSPAFPPDFRTSFELGQPVTGFQHRFENRLLEVVLLKS